jgi:dethiobiotin synthetase
LKQSFLSTVSVDVGASASAPPTVKSSGEGPKNYSPIYVAATRQHVGKTTVSLALMSGLQQRFKGRVGFLKPVGQHSLTVTDIDGQQVNVDKDAALIKQHFQLDHLSYQHTSPVLIPPGYTRDFLDGLITSKQQTDLIQEAYKIIKGSCDVVLCEGTGHVAVGSIGTNLLREGEISTSV